MKRSLFGFLILSLLVFIFGCSTSIPVTVTKPAEINMSANRVIAVLDFRYPVKGKTITGKDLLEWAISKLTGLDLPDKITVEQKVAEYTTSQVISTLLNTGYFQLVSPQEVARTMQGGISSSTTAVDIGKAVKAQAIVNGELYLLETEDQEWTDERTVTDAGTGQEQIVYVPMIKRTVWVGMSYQVVNTATGNVVASRSFDSQSSTDRELEDKRNLPDVEDMYARIIDSFMPRMAKQLAPYQVREHRTLMRDKTKDPRMEQADDLVKGKIYDSALEIFLRVWRENGNIAAGFNAAILYEVTGQLDTAIEQMKDVVELTADKKAMREYNRLLTVKQEQERLREQQS
ncbi:MAG: hypothetical protein JSV89_03105 [Spirochaetaceae bacterium]|nr:MAG: hypothetical protein JSV89_03105 [Spirochaetaceae bacterium]